MGPPSDSLQLVQITLTSVGFMTVDDTYHNIGFINQLISVGPHIVVVNDCQYRMVNGD